MDGSDMAFDYKAVAAGIARSEGMGALLPVVEKELLHYRILSAMQDGGFFGPIVFQGGTSLRLCHGSPRYSEDLDFAGGTGFGVDDLRGLGECVRSPPRRHVPGRAGEGSRTGPGRGPGEEMAHIHPHGGATS